MRAPLLVVVASLGMALPARADDLQATLGEPLVEVSHNVQVRLVDGVAVYTVLRRIRNDGQRHEEAIVSLTVPPGAAATGLRINASGVWYDAELLDTEEAAARYMELTGMGASTPRDPALLSWTAPGALTLQVFPVFPGGTSTVEYTFTAPMEYEDGRIVLWYPEPARGGALAATTFQIDAGHPDGDVRVERRVAMDGYEAATEGEGDRWTRISVAPPPIAEVAARYASFAVGWARTVFRLELDAAPVMEPAPKGAHVVFVIDASYSEGEEGIRAQLDIVRGYLANLPDASFDVVLFRRDAERLVGDLVPAKRLDEVLAGAARPRLAPGNGSNLDAGLALAAKTLAGVTGPARIVVLTDARLRRRFTVPSAVAALAGAPAGTVVHVVLRHAGGGAELAERRDDAHPLSPLAAAYGGMLLEITGDAPKGSGLAEVTLGLVRPIRIDGFTITGDGLADQLYEVPAVLDEGTGHRWTLLLGAAPAKLVLRGKIWGRAWQREVPVDAAFGARLPALVVGDPLLQELDPDEMRTVAYAGRAVSPETSYLAVEPGTRPSSAGIVRGGVSGGVGGSGGFGMMGSGAGGGGYMEADPPDRIGLLRKWLADGAAACVRRTGAAELEATITFEATADEIVDVTVAGPALTTVAAACLEDAAWAIRLDQRFRAEGERYVVPMRVAKR